MSCVHPLYSSQIECLGFYNAELDSVAPATAFMLLCFCAFTGAAGADLVTIILPMCLIVTTSWSHMFISQTELADQLTIILTMLLTAVAFQFAIQQILPEKPCE